MHSEHTIHYIVDDEPQTTTEHSLTPTQILQNAHIDPATNYMVEIEHHERESFKDKPNEPIEMVNGMRFVSVYDGPTPVS